MYNLMIVDDEIIIRNSLTRTIDWGSLGIHVAAVLSNGKEAVEYIESYPVDLIISDIKMPFMDGMELLKYVNEHAPDIKVILLTGYAEFSYAKQAVKYNVCDYMLKPVQRQELEEVVRRSIQAIEEKKVVLELMELQGKEQKNTQLKRCLLGTASEEEQKEVLQEVKEYGIVLLLYDFNENQIKRQKAYFERIEKLIKSPYVQKQLQSAKLKWYLVDIQPNKQCLLLYTADEQSRMDRLFVRQIAKLVYEYATEKEQELTVTVSYKENLNVPNRIPQMYAEVLETLNRRHILGNNRILESSPVSEPQKEVETLSYPSEEILEHMRFGQVEEVRGDINAIYDKFLKGHVYASLSAVRNLSVELAITIFRLQQSGEEQVSFLYFLNELQTLNTVEALKDKILELALTVAKGNVGKYQKSQARIAEEALDYIRKEYAEQDLGLERVADALHVSTTYLSVTLKRATGHNFSTHLLNIRMERAKELLQKDSLKLQDVAESVGYSSSQYFSVCFKKYTGMTPSQFREVVNIKYE